MPITSTLIYSGSPLIACLTFSAPVSGLASSLMLDLIGLKQSLQVLERLSQKVDHLIVGGGIANTFIAAAGHAVGKSLHEPDLIPQAQALLEAGERAGRAAIPIPTDVVVAKEFSATAEADVKSLGDIAADDMIMDVGPDTAERLARLVSKAGTVVWNGPLGVFEFDQFGEGTHIVAQAVAESGAFSIAGGGDTLAAIASGRGLVGL